MKSKLGTMKVNEYRLGNIESVMKLEEWRDALHESDIVGMIEEIKRAWSFIACLSEETASREIKVRSLEFFGKEMPHLVVEHGFRHPNRPKLEIKEDADEAGD